VQFFEEVRRRFPQINCQRVLIQQADLRTVFRFVPTNRSEDRRGMVVVSISFGDAQGRFERISSRLSDRGAAFLFRISSPFASSCGPEAVQARRLFAEAGDERQAEGSCLMRMGEILKELNPTLAKTLLEEVSRLYQSIRLGYADVLQRRH